MIAETIIASVIAGTSVCSDHFENVSRYNPTDLSDYQMCVHTVHGNEAGTVGKNFWFQVDNKFYYVPLEDLAGESRSEVSNLVVETVIVQELEAELATLKMQAEGLRSLGEQYREQAEAAAAKVELAEAAIEAGIDIPGFDIPDAPAHGDFVVSRNNQPGLPNIETVGLDLRLEVNGSTYNIGSYNSGLTSTFAPAWSTMTVGQKIGVVNAVRRVANDAIAAGYQAGFEQGYEEGYDAGYQEGYADGFADGVASVK